MPRMQPMETPSTAPPSLAAAGGTQGANTAGLLSTLGMLGIACVELQLLGTSSPTLRSSVLEWQAF
jgi:hypothetical protein